MSTFNSLPSEASPQLTDSVFAARGTLGSMNAGAERAPNLSSILSLYAKATATANRVPLADGTGKIDVSWIPTDDITFIFRKGTNAERLLITPAQAEGVYTTDTKELWIGDGSVVGGIWAAGGSTISYASNIYTLTRLALGTTAVPAISVKNTTAATALAQSQYSPQIVFEGTAWNANTPGSETVQMKMFIRTSPGDPSTSILVFRDDAVANEMTFNSSNGTLSAAKLVATSNLSELIGGLITPNIGDLSNTYQIVMDDGFGGINIVAPHVWLSGDFWLDRTIASTTGAATINQPAGRVQFAAAAASLVVTNSLVTADSMVFCTVMSNDTTMKSCSAVAAAGSFTLRGNAAPTATTLVSFLVINGFPSE